MAVCSHWLLVASTVGAGRPSCARASCHSSHIALLMIFISTSAAFSRSPSGTDFCRRSEEHTSELQSHSDLHSFPTRRSSDLLRAGQLPQLPHRAVDDLHQHVGRLLALAFGH